MKQQIVTALWRLSKLVNIVVAVPLVLAGAAMVGVVVAGTVFRYALFEPLVWSEAAARYLMIWIGLVGASVALRHNDHIAIDALRNRLPSMLRHFGDLIVALAIAWFLWVMITEGWANALRGVRQAAPGLGMSMFWPMLSVPVAGVAILIQHVLHTLLNLLDAEVVEDNHIPGGGAF